jgi:small subunit ribosomal protein S1
MTDEFNDDSHEENFAELLEAYSGGMSDDIQVGEKIKGRIISISKDTVFMDTGTKIDGAVDITELRDADGNCPYQLGDELDLYVTAMTESEITLSRALSGVGGANQLRDAFREKIPVEGKVSDTCKGGVHVEILQRRAFCPISHLDLTYVENADDYVGKTFPFLITRFEENGRNIVVSRRELLKQQQDAEQKKVYDQLTVDSEWDGCVTRLMPFGAFVDLGSGVEGMVHVSELGWARVESPQDVVNVGDTLRVKVIGIKPGEGKERLKISLSAKQIQSNPWDSLEGKFKIGEIVEGKVIRTAKFGAFVEIAPGIEGLVHISEMSYEKRIVNPEDVVRVNDKISVAIKEIDLSKRRISLSIRDTQGDPWVSFKSQFSDGQSLSGIVENKEKFGFFIKLAPGITGLLPQSKINQHPDKAMFEKLKPGDTIPVLIEEIKWADKRVTLAPADASEADDWKKHVQSGGNVFGSLGEKLQQALRAKEKKGA